MSFFLTQFLAIQEKNWKINFKGKEYLRENISVIILSVLIVVSEQITPNQLTTPFYLAIAAMGFSRTAVLWWVNEKETHQKELQKIMGVSQLSYITSWIAYLMMNATLVTITMMLIVKFLVITDETNFAPGYGFPDIALIYFLFSVSNIGFIMVVSAFFTKAKTAAQAITFIQLLINLLFFLRFSDFVRNSEAMIFLLSLFPQLSFNMGISSIAFIDSRLGFQFNFNYQQGIVMLIVTFFAYVLLALYLDEVMPNELGTHRHPLFFLKCFKKQPSSSEHSLPLMEERILDEKLENQKESSAKYEQFKERKTQPLAKMINISKQFGVKTVVDQLSLNFYQSEIFCLLGHNGAGKSTSINLLTGMLTPTQGTIQILGMTYPEEVQQIRKNIGLCLQYNVLYDNLTIEEHLRYYFKIKNLSHANIQQEVNRIIDQCALAAERGKLSKNLSGGNKRKLCLANSLIGGSRIVFLDEPSSGLDPNSRQQIWGILKNLKQEKRCVILTTHHLEEAEELSRRIAILSKGKLIIVGDKQFITDKFSVGYHLVMTLTKKGVQSQNKCRDVVFKNIEGVIEDKQSAANTLKFILPLKEINKFSYTFKILEDFKIGSISCFMSNLEDAFIKIGAEEEQEQIEGLVQIKQDQDIPDVQLPNVHCSYSFPKQFKAIFFRKMKTTLRSLSTLVSLVMPAIFITIGALIVCLAIKTDVEEDKRIIERIRLFMISYFMILAFVFTTSSYCGSIVLERQKRFKYLSNVMGTRKLPYWTANYAFDFIIFIVPLIIYFILTYSLGEEGRFLTRFNQYLIPMLILFGFSFIGYSYVFSFVFQKSNTAYRFFPFLNLIFFYFLPLIPGIVNQQGILAQYVMPLISPFVAFSVFFNTQEVTGFPDNGLHNIAIPYICLTIQSIVYLLFTLYLEHLRFSLNNDTRNYHQLQPLHQQIHQQQQGDRRQQPQLQQLQHLQNLEHGRQSVNNSNSYPIYVNKLTKQYPNGYHAIRDNSFYVKKQEIFGLLGPNGAGKSTTFNIITAALTKSSGNVKLFNQEINQGIMQIFQNVGVCPQYNPLYQNLSVRDHLTYFALIKGIDGSDLQSVVSFYCNLLSLTPYIDVKAGVLSGGNKRKMCVAMAMIGNPEVLFFDEPSAGVDPISRRFLWKALSASAKTKKASMILTTHSMNEAESLCSVIGILIKGKFVCLDTPKKLKDTFGKGFRVNVVAELEFHQELKETVKKQFGQDIKVQTNELNKEQLVFIIKNENFLLSKGFYVFQECLAGKGKLKRFEIKESTLEEVFIHLSKLQPEVVEEAYKEPWQLLCWEWGQTGCQMIA